MDFKYKRVLIKISGEALSSGDQTFCSDRINAVAQDIKSLHDKGINAALVVGGGNILRGRSVTGTDRNRADHMGMLATAINALALEDALIAHDVPCKVLSAVEMQRFCDTYSSREANAALDNGTVVIFACGTGSPFFSTDTAAALRALEIHADALLLAKNVDYIYDKNPDIHPDAKPYYTVSYDEVIEKNLKATDITTITLCRDFDLPILLFSLMAEDCFFRVLSGENVGTVIH